MVSKTLLIIGCAVLAGAPAAAKSAGDEKTTICHRTGAKPVRPDLFRGQIITIATGSVPDHVDGHGDIVIEPSDHAKFGSSKICHTDGAKKLYDSKGQPIHPVQTPPPGNPWGGGGGDEGSIG